MAWRARTSSTYSAGAQVTRRTVELFWQARAQRSRVEREDVPLIRSSPTFERVDVRACDCIRAVGFDDAKRAPRGIAGRGHEAMQGGAEPPLEFRRAPFEGAFPDLPRRKEELGSCTPGFRLRFVALDCLPVGEADRDTA